MDQVINHCTALRWFDTIQVYKFASTAAGAALAHEKQDDQEGQLNRVQFEEFINSSAFIKLFEAPLPPVESAAEDA